MSRSAIRIGCLLSVAVMLAACGEGVATPSSSPSTIPPPLSASPVTSASPAPGGSSATIVVDQALIDHLPVDVDGIPLESDPDTAGTIATDPTLAAHASAIAVAFAVAPGAPVGDDLAVVSVVQLRPGVFGESFYRSWRDSYDAAACEPAGGTTGNAQAEIAGRATFIGSCAAGAHTYHVYLAGANVLVSVTSVGERRLGEQVIAGLRE